MNVMNIIRSLIRRATITLGGKDDLDVPIQQVSYLGKTADVEIITPYGVHANLPTNNDVLMTMWSVAGQEDFRVGMGYTPKLRPKETPVGEVIFYHPLTQSRVQFKNNGDIEIDSTGDNGSTIITIKKDLSITVLGDTTINTTGDTTVTTDGNAVIDVTGTATVDCPTTNWTGDINLTGNLDITGNLEVSGSTTLSSTVTSNGKDISDTHTHVGSATAPSGPVAPTGAPV